MTTPTIQTTNSGNRDTADTNQPITLPAGITAGDLLIAFLGHKDTANGATWPAGWTEFNEQLNAGGSGAALSVAYRWADGSEGATVTPTTVASVRMAYAVYRISGALNPSTQAPEAAGTTALNTVNPDPPTLTPTGGAKDYLWLVAFASSHGRITSSLPTNYSTNVGAGANDATVTKVGVGSGNRANNAASENPGTFTTTGTAVEEIAVMTVAIHPAAGGGVSVPVLYHQLQQQGIG